MMLAFVLCAVALQAVVMLVDEGYFHRRRGLPRWERIGHPLDTLSVAACYAWLLIATPAHTSSMGIYVALAAFSCLLVTKDEVVHARVCTRAECWLHAVLFVLHPIVLAGIGYAWLHGEAWLVRVQLALTLSGGVYQVVYWNLRHEARA
jgi:hypothetical protein